MDLPVLDPTEQRVLGSLLEKQTTVPASYPMTLKALRTACNQTSSRHPVMELDEPTVEQTARTLKDRGLVRVVWADAGRRTLKYHQLLDERLELAPDERALVTVLLLRGAQAPGELRSRTERLHHFADRGEVEECLHRLAARTQPLVEELQRRPGQQDRRWVHLLGPVLDDLPVAAAHPAVDRDAVIADGAEARDSRVRTSYDAVAGAYADQLTEELDHLAFERWLLDRVAAESAGPVVDAGCGPGHVTAYLAAVGADVTGLDLSHAMVAEASDRFPSCSFQVGDLRRLMRPPTSAGWGAVLAWYSLIHLAASELPDALAGLARPLLPGGLLVLALHAGSDVRHLDEWFGQPVDLDFVLHDPADIVRAVEAAGFLDVEWYHRGPHAWRGETTERLYVVGRRPRST